MTDDDDLAKRLVFIGRKAIHTQAVEMVLEVRADPIEDVFGDDQDEQATRDQRGREVPQEAKLEAFTSIAIVRRVEEQQREATRIKGQRIAVVQVRESSAGKYGPFGIEFQTRARTTDDPGQPREGQLGCSGVGQTRSTARQMRSSSSSSGRAIKTSPSSNTFDETSRWVAPLGNFVCRITTSEARTRWTRPSSSSRTSP